MNDRFNECMDLADCFIDMAADHLTGKAVVGIEDVEKANAALSSACKALSMARAEVEALNAEDDKEGCHE